MDSKPTPTVEELWQIVQEQAGELAELKSRRQPDGLPEIKGERKLSRAGLLKFAAAGAVAATAAGATQVLSGTQTASADSGLVGGQVNYAQHTTILKYDGAFGFGANVLTANDSNYAATSPTYPAALGGYAGYGDTVGYGGTANGVYGFTDNPDGYGVVGYGTAGTGVFGRSDTTTGVSGQGGQTGVFGTGSTAGVWGNSSGGAGVVGLISGGQSPSYVAGVYGDGGNFGDGIVGIADRSGGTGVVGIGNGVGISGRTGAGVGVEGISATGRGGAFSGGAAQIQLLPATTKGKPTKGAHRMGDLFLDKAATLYICTKAGTPGTWRKVTTMPA